MIGTSHKGSGYGRLIRSLLTGLSDYAEVFHLALDVAVASQESEFVVEHCTSASDWYGLEAAKKHIDAISPHIVLVIGEMNTLLTYGRLFKVYKGFFKSIAYVPFGARPEIDECFDLLRNFDALVPFTVPCRNVLIKLLGESSQIQQPIPHGIDLSVFHKLPKKQKQALRKQVLGQEDINAETLLILNGNKDYTCKRLDLTVKAYADFKSELSHPNVKLLLPGISDECLESMRYHYQLKNDLISPDTPFKFPMSDTNLNSFYNVCDVGVNTSSTESWGMLSFEHAATGALQVVHDHWVTGYLWNGYASMISSQQQRGERYSIAAEIDVHKLSHEFFKIYHYKSYLKEGSAKSWQYATNKIYSWSRITRQWLQLFEQLMDSQ